ncbi:MAG: hypothetical protein ABSC55_18120 [Syntrophorhabdales bacterium]|jgi:hypothetical protein
MDEVIARLKREKEESENNYQELGKADGQKWANAAHYTHLEYVATKEGSFVDELDSTTDKVLGEYFTGVIEEHPFMHYEDKYNRRRTNDCFDSWLRGWEDAVVEFWNKVSPEL